MQGSPLESTVAQIPNQLANATVKQRLTDIARKMDQIGRFDPHSQEVYFDETGLRNLLQETNSPGFEQQALNALLASKRVITDAKKSAAMSAISWQELGRHTFNTTPESFTSLGANNATTQDALLALVRKHMPNVPEKAFAPGELAHRIEQMLQHPLGGSQATQADITPNVNVNGVIVCCESRLGFWAVVSIVGAIVCLAVTFPNIALGLALAGIWIGFITLATIITCITTNL